MRRYENVAIDKLKPYEKNARTHSPEQVDKIAKSIEQFGFINPVLIDGDYGIIAGHGRVMGAKQVGLTEVPCIFVEDLTDTQKRAYILADNKLALDAGWDDEILKAELNFLKEVNFDISLTGFDMGEIDLNATDIEFKEDDFDVDHNLPAEPKAKLGDIYQLGRHRIMCGSSTNAEDVKKLVDGAVMDLCVTDPPYNVNYGSINETVFGKERNNANKILNDNMDDLSFYNFLLDFYTNMMSVLKEGGAFYIFHADSESLNFRGALKEAGGTVKETLIWVKNALVLGRQDYQWKHEPCLYGWKEGAGHYFIDDRCQTTVFEDDSALQKMSKDQLIQLVKQIQEEQCPTTIIHENKPTKNDLHPTMKPINLIGRLVKNSSREKENVFDGFGGSGSTLIACEQLKRNAYLMELDPKYIDVQIKRWEDFTGKKAVKLN
jgi:DNA modification methylase